MRDRGGNTADKPISGRRVAVRELILAVTGSGRTCQNFNVIPPAAFVPGIG